MTPPPREVFGSAYSTLARAGVDAAAALTWDPELRRPPRVLVPMDVRALCIPAGDAEPVAQVLSPLPDPAVDGSGTRPEVPKIAPFTDGTAGRAPGVYLHWAAVDGLAAARAAAPDGSAAAGSVTSAPLADRYLVVRVGGGVPRRTRAWVVEAERGQTIDLAGWSAQRDAGAAGGGRTPHFSSDALTATAGGDPAWAALFDTSQDRFALYDSLDDLAVEDRRGTVSYLVCGWWSQDGNDPIYAGTLAERRSRLTDLGWMHSAVSPELQSARDLLVSRGPQLGLSVPGARTMETVDTADRITATVAEARPHEILSAVAGNVLAGGVPPLPGLTLLHGSVIGVLPDGPAQGGDDRPAAGSVEVAVGASATEAFAALLAHDQAADQRIADERLVAAFCDGLISQLDAPDGLVTLDQELQAAEFVSQPGGAATTDRLVGGDRVAAARAKADAGATVAGSLAARSVLGNRFVTERRVGFLSERTSFDTVAAHSEKNPPPAAPAQLTTRELTVAAPAWRFPADPVVTLRSVNRSLRHGYDGRFTVDRTLQCRVSGEERVSLSGLLDGFELVAPLGNGNLPPECDQLLQELALEDPTQVDAAASYAASARSLPVSAVSARLRAEHALRWDTTLEPAAKDAIRPASLWAGTEASPVANTFWRQPWVPLFLEWELSVDVDDDLSRWTLAEVDLDVAGGAAAAPAAAVAPLTASGRVLLTSMVARQFADKVASFVAEEAQRGASAVLEASEQTALGDVAAAGALFDVLSGGLAGLREELLGLDWAEAGRVTVDESGTRALPTPVRPPVLLRGGVASFVRLRVVDAFGRTVEIPPSALTGAAIAERLQVPAMAPSPAPAPAPASGQDGATPILLRPRLTRPARLVLQFVVPRAADRTVPGPATVDQVDPTQMVNPVSGWLLADHLDGALEVFDAGAEELGMLREDLNGHVVWEGAPGLPGPIGAPPAPLASDDAGTRHVVRLAAGVVLADAVARNAAAAPGGTAVTESALSALLRTIDTTLWTVDPFGTTGNEHIAGLVGRPIAVVRMTLRIDVLDDLGTGADAELNLSGDVLAARQAAYERLASRQIAVRLGELTRTDDSVLGYFADDDYSRFTPVSPEVLAAARATGRHVGQLSVLGPGSAGDPAIVPIAHPFIDDTEQPLVARPGQLVTLTVLMLPGGSVHATCGVLPRVGTALARDWVADALRRLSPSFRVGPVLLDPKTVRLPKITALPKNQVFTARTDETKWADATIAAATQDALLPDDPPLFREGYVRAQAVGDSAAGSPSSGGPGGSGGG